MKKLIKYLFTLLAANIVVLNLVFGCFAKDLLLPCQYLYSQNDLFSKHKTELDNLFLSTCQENNIKILFAMYILPSFKPESAIVIYKGKSEEAIVETFETDNNVWSEIARKRIYEDYTQQNINIKSLNKKAISMKVALNIIKTFGNIINTASGSDIDFNRNKTYLEGTRYFFLINNGDRCAAYLPRENELGELVKFGELLCSYTKSINYGNKIVKESEIIQKLAHVEDVVTNR